MVPEGHVGVDGGGGGKGGGAEIGSQRSSHWHPESSVSKCLL